MGRKGIAGFPLFLLTGLLMVAPVGCRDRSAVLDAGTAFTPSGVEQIRELGIFAGTERVGDLVTSRVSGRWHEEEAVRFSESVHLRLSFRSDRFNVTSSQISWVGEGLDLKASTATMDFGAGKWETRVLKVKGNVYERDQINSGSKNHDRVNVPEGAIISDVLPLYLEETRMEKDATVNLGVFNMTLDQEFPLTIHYRGLTEEGRLYALSYWGMDERLWLDETGMVVREDMLLGVSARAPGEKEQVGYLALETILAQTAVPGLQIPADLGSRDSAVFVLQGSFRPPEDSRWQRVKVIGDQTELTLMKPRLPVPGQRLPNMDLIKGGDFGLDLDSPRIRELSQKIIGSREDPWEKAVAIGRWVNREVGKSMRECFSALQVLETGEGECQSHSLLTVSLCRAAGLPARFAYGVVYLPDRDAFGFHTWVEVHVGDWIPMDPTLGNFPAGVDHITLAVGGYQDQFRLFPYIMGQGGWRIKFREQ